MSTRMQLTDRRRSDARLRDLPPRLLASLAVTPVSLVGVVAALVGRRAAAADWSRRLGQRMGPLTDVSTRPAPPAAPVVVAHGVVAAAMGVLAWVSAAVLAAFVLRGPLYGIVVSGPYDAAWGAPTLAGAWMVHALVGLALSPVAVVVMMRVVGALYVRLVVRMLSRQGPIWVVPVSVVLAVLAGLLLWVWASHNAV